RAGGNPAGSPVAHRPAARRVPSHRDEHNPSTVPRPVPARTAPNWSSPENVIADTHEACTGRGRRSRPTSRSAIPPSIEIDGGIAHQLLPAVGGVHLA